MRGAILLGVIVTALVTVVITSGTAVNTVVGGTQQQENSQFANVSCNAALGPWQGGDQRSGSDDAARLTDEQRGTAALIISIGKQRNLPPLAWQVAIQAGMTESGLRSLNYGDLDSVGIFQMRPSMNWGTVAQILDPSYAINKFFDVLQNVPDWQHKRPGDSSQAVERSAFPDRYHQWESMGAYLIANLGKVTDPTGCGQGTGAALPASAAAATAIKFAQGQLGKPYLWGGTGPDAYDCSGLMVKAYAAAGVIIPRVANDQYMRGTAYLPVRQAQAGDLLFWATDPTDPVTIHHVAMYLGNDQYLQAPQDNDVVKISKIDWTNHELVAQAVRPGV
ncbi:NlpC/P60 family protein [Solihabitans fulvus]|uniref:NlpC/P60 family protein n=1 Tax=Solihabitans fulvus TaxID=1892852 RepID=A0A5B2XJ43_9PSEU|nr:C40 family peptidase [Solihabitans fulvus]KAA2263858.1 NlpC/P60 family protein [Solihabitans fulvus]